MRIYIVIMVCVMCIGAYVAGYRVGVANAIVTCERNTTVHLIKTIKRQEKINEKINHTAVRDIRRVLREKYTIAE
ncbi:MAG: hypothetical protein NC311_05430 [Muribaculaceae bacterium]|nr:hypothetical protein [Muribaculaceae bacterium]